MQAYEQDELIKTGIAEYSTKTHDSLKISNGRWHWWSRNIGGRTALDYLIKVKDMSFTDAVRKLGGGAIEETIKSQNKYPEHKAPTRKGAEARASPEFEPPQAAVCAGRAVSYLQKRGIDSEVIYKCVKLGIVYESADYHNCVFVGLDKQGIKRYAALRGTLADFKGEAKGSDKRFGFCLSAGNSKSSMAKFVNVCESPVDALSLATIEKMNRCNWQDTNYLSLGGTSEKALIQFLKDNTHVEGIIMCLDNDDAGLTRAKKIEAEIVEMKEFKNRKIEFLHAPPDKKHGKDYNDALLYKLNKSKEAQEKLKVNDKANPELF